MPDSDRHENSTKIAGKPTELNSGRTGLPWPVLVIALLALAGLLTFAWNIGSRLLDGSSKQSAERLEPAETEPDAPEEDNLEPVSILPQSARIPSEGTTILEKRPDEGAQVSGFGAAPVAQGADIASGYAMDLGKADSFFDLSKRFAVIVTDNGPENFQRLEPRAVLIDTVAGLEARLLVGPFEDEDSAAEACSVLALPEDIECQPTLFEGELIARQ